MSKYEKSARFEEREVRDSRRDRHDRDRSEKDRDTRRRRRRSPSYSSESDSDDSYYSDYSRGASPPRRPTRRHTAAAPASHPHAHSDGEERGYRKSRGRDRRGHDSDYYSDRSPSRSRERREKGSVVEDLLAAIGLLQSKHKDDKGTSSRSAAAGGPEDEHRKKKTREALQAALTAAAMEAFRTRKDGKITPQRLMQIAGAAIAAGGLDVLVDQAARLGGKGGEGGNSGNMRTIIESVVGTLAASKSLGGGNGKHRGAGEASLGAKIGSGVVNLAAKHLARSMSQGPTRRKTTRY
ncbi:hypothetical protein TWF481_002080 [Arthrobotrys musiformis]|uniref:Uncharacterized protein n=1 Tax=Arthrobotrys musiformis TaxID=47236 RepID=A0AAV9VS56_9PEZI